MDNENSINNTEINDTADKSIPDPDPVPERIVPQKKPFLISPEELALIPLSFLAGYFYIKILDFILLFIDNASSWYLLALTAVLVFIVEFLNRKKERSIESMMLLACFLVCSIALALNGLIRRTPLFIQPYQNDRIWSSGQVFLFIHVFFLWYVMSRSGRLLDGVTGHLLPADALNAAVKIPFGNFFLRSRTLVSGLSTAVGSKEKIKLSEVGIFAVLMSAVLLVSATSLLMEADETFELIISGIADHFSLSNYGEFLINLILSIPVGAWLWGLIGGTYRYPDEKLERNRSSILRFLETLARVSGRIWTVIIAVFSAVYLLFFAVQADYFFGCLFGRLPEGFIVSEYARRGFFELCRVMAINFVVLWMATRTADRETRDSKLFRSSCLLMLGESIIFSVISIAKLALYISSFGITPLRIQSSWFAAVLLAGCILWIYAILTKKETFRYWMYFGAVTLAVLAAI